MASPWNSQIMHIYRLNLQSYMGVQFMVPPNNYSGNKYNNDEKKLKYCQNYQNVTQKPEVSKCCWKNGLSRPGLCRVATSLQFFRNTIYLQSG